MEHEEIVAELDALVVELIRKVTTAGVGVREGTVMTTGPAPYRRLDCDGRALAYVRTRPKKRAVRVDVSGLWMAEFLVELSVPGAAGANSLMLRDGDEVDRAVAYLQATVARTRAAHQARRSKRSA